MQRQWQPPAPQLHPASHNNKQLVDGITSRQQVDAWAEQLKPAGSQKRVQKLAWGTPGRWTGDKR
jgi:hypothetical protein